MTANKIDKIFSLMPQFFVGKKNVTALLTAIGQSDQDIQDDYIEVRKQLFIDTATGQYLERLGNNVGVLRPSVVSMQDTDYRQFIKLMAYHPKQIRQLMFKLLDLFYGVDATHVSITSQKAEPYVVIDGMLELNLDSGNALQVDFRRSTFATPDNVTAYEIVSTINSQVGDFAFSTVKVDESSNTKYIQVYTRTEGPTGRVSVTGGAANTFLRFPEILSIGQAISTLYRVKSEFSTMKVYWAGNDQPDFSKLTIGDKLILSGTSFLDENKGSFDVIEVRSTGIPAVTITATAAIYTGVAGLVDFSVTDTSNINAGARVLVSGFANPPNNTDPYSMLTLPSFLVDSVVTPGTPGVVRLLTARSSNADDETGASATIDTLPNAAYVSTLNDTVVEQNTAFALANIDDLLYFRPEMRKLESSQRVATVFEINPNELVITLPATPSVVRRSLHGVAHLQGAVAKVLQVIGDGVTNDIVLSASKYFPETHGNFFMVKSDGVVIQEGFRYLTKIGETLTQVNGELPIYGNTINVIPAALTFTGASQVVRVATQSTHGLAVGERVRLSEFSLVTLPTSLVVDVNGMYSVTGLPSVTEFEITVPTSKFTVPVFVGTVRGPLNSFSQYSTTGVVYSAKNSYVMITNVGQNTGYIGAYLYDPKGNGVVSAITRTTLSSDIQAGAIASAINVADVSQFPESPGKLILDYGTDSQEGPVKYIAIPNQNTLYIDPAYIFQKSHAAGSVVNSLRSVLPTQPSVDAREYAAYLTDTTVPRETLKSLIRSAAATGVVVRFVLILPENVYNAYSLYE